MENFIREHLKTCKAKRKQCNKCGMTSDFGKVCRNNPNNTNKRTTAPRRINWVEADDEQKLTDEQEEEQYVLGIDGGGSPPFMMKGRINKKKFCLMIDSGSPVTIIGYDELQRFYNMTYYLYDRYQRMKNPTGLQQTTGRLIGVDILRTGSRKQIYSKSTNIGV